MFDEYNVGCKHRLHLENGLEYHFKEWIKVIGDLRKPLAAAVSLTSRAKERNAIPISDVICLSLTTSVLG